MSIVAAAVLWALSPALQDEPESPLGPKKVKLRSAVLLSAPPPPREVIGRADYGEDVTVLEVKGAYVRVRREKGGATAFIARTSLVDPKHFEPHPENDEEKAKLRAENYKSGRFDNTTEKEYIKQKGPEMQRAYDQLEALMNRPYKQDLKEYEKNLAGFRKDGKLGEFSPVK
jgi:hypothetical protein